MGSISLSAIRERRDLPFARYWSDFLLFSFKIILEAVEICRLGKVLPCFFSFGRWPPYVDNWLKAQVIRMPQRHQFFLILPIIFSEDNHLEMQVNRKPQMFCLSRCYRRPIKFGEGTFLLMELLWDRDTLF